MQFRLLWSFLFISENPLTLGNILYKTLFWKQFNSSKCVSMKAIIIGRAICHTHTVSPVILWLRCSQMGNGSAIASGEQNFILEREDLPSKCSKPQEYSELLCSSCIISLAAFCFEYLWWQKCGFFRRVRRGPKTAGMDVCAQAAPSMQGNPFSLKVAASSIAKLDLRI